jgi:hypothetical protein
MNKAENALAVREQQPPQLPATLEERKAQTDQTIEIATHWAKRLIETVERCGMATKMGGKTYLEAEAWQMIAEFAHVTPVVEWVRPWKDDNEALIGYEARVKLVNAEGQEIGAGESSCGLDAFPCRGKQGTEKDKAAKASAQTWAISRALRNKFSFVAKLAGYQAVPAEEMPREVHDEDLRKPKPGGNVISEPQRKRFYAICQKSEIPEPIIREEMKRYGFAHSRDITRERYEKLCEWAENWAPEGAPEMREPGDDDDD